MRLLTACLIALLLAGCRHTVTVVVVTPTPEPTPPPRWHVMRGTEALKTPNDWADVACTFEREDGLIVEAQEMGRQEPYVHLLANNCLGWVLMAKANPLD